MSMQKLKLLGIIGLCILLSGCFLGPDAFSGSFLPRQSDATTGGEATYHGHVVFTNVSRAIVEQVLPAGLRLAPNVSWTQNVHPVVYLYGHQTNTQWVILGNELPVGNDYQELILLIPFVQQLDHEKWHNYIVRIYLNDPAARDLGNVWFGYAKRDATFQETVSVSDPTVAEFTVLVSGQPAFHAKIKTLGSWQANGTAQQMLRNYHAIQTIFEMPILGLHDIGSFICSYFEWKYDNAMVAPVRSRHEFLQPFTAAMGTWPDLGTLRSVYKGAISIRNLEWRLKHPPPAPCQF